MLKLAGVVLGMLFIVACASPGWRNEHGCPPGEDCSDQTPDGLYFAGPDFADDWVQGIQLKRVAVGGTQDIRVQLGPARASWGFDGPFDAITQEPEVEVTNVIEPMVEIRGVAEGNAWLRIVDPTNGDLFDLIQVSSLTVDELDVLPVELGTRDAALSGEAWGVLVGQPTSLFARLATDGGARLVDQSLSFTADSTLSPHRWSWDALEVDAQVAGGHSVTVVAGTTTTTVNVLAVDDITGIAIVSARDLTLDEPVSFSDPLIAEHDHMFCFSAHSGPVRVVDPAWTFTSSGVIGGVFFDEPNLLAPAGCFLGGAVEPGLATMTIGAAGLAVDVDLEFVTGTPLRVPDTTVETATPLGASPGQRAR